MPPKKRMSFVIKKRRIGTSVTQRVANVKANMNAEINASNKEKAICGTISAVKIHESDIDSTHESMNITNIASTSSSLTILNTTCIGGSTEINSTKFEEIKDTERSPILKIVNEDIKINVCADEESRKKLSFDADSDNNYTDRDKHRELSVSAKRQRLGQERQTESDIQQRVVPAAECMSLITEKKAEVERKRRLAVQAERKRLQRERESEEDRQERLAAAAERDRVRRERETEVEREQRLADMAERVRQSRERESEVEREQRLADMAEKVRQSRERESEVEREQRLADMAEKVRQSRERESEVEREQRLADMAEKVRQSRERESEVEREERLVAMAERDRFRREGETQIEREERLVAMAERDRFRREGETQIEREQRLAIMAERDKHRRERESALEREQRLTAMAERNRFRRKEETELERQERLLLAASRVRNRREEETEEERSHRLEDMAERARNNREERRDPSQRMRQWAATGNYAPYYNIGEIDEQCSTCSAKHFLLEKPQDGKFTSCCHKGKVQIEALQPYPPLLHQLLTGQHGMSTNFLKNIRNYNTSFAFASVGVNITFPPGRGPYCFRIHGQVYHSMCHINKDERNPKYAQLYFLDEEMAVRQRSALPENVNCDDNLMHELDQLFRQINPFAEGFKFLMEVEREEQIRSRAEGHDLGSVFMRIKEDRRYDQRRYNTPTANEVAVVFKSQDGVPPLERDIKVYERTGRFFNISILSPNCDPLCYPILFPKGEPGWQTNMPHMQAQCTRNKNVTLLEFYSHRLSIRDGFNPLLNAGKLTQQFIVDAYVKVEANRLEFHRKNQNSLRVELYQGLMDSLHNRAVDNRMDVGRMVILPSTFQGSPRAMHQHYQDAMAMITKFGKPDLFITFTCNPKWPEILQNLEPWQRAEHRPDLIVRVFHLKLKEMMDDINNKHIFGIKIATMHVIEFQKRGLPHAHILIILQDEDKFRESEDIDSIVCAEFPDAVNEPDLFEVVCTSMVHGPCGTENPQAPCMKDGKCSKGYPKEFCPHTIVNDNGYPKYMRRNNGTSVCVRNRNMDNRNVVPYNKWLLTKYNAHINVEICSSIKSVKYLCKYVYKGHDCAVLEVGTTGNTLHWDEIKTYEDTRYVSAPEAMWRILECKMHEQSHHIIRLAVHLPNLQEVYFRPGDEENAAQRAANKDTTLTAWFKLNQSEEEAKTYLYTEIPLHFVFQRNGSWKKRVRGESHIIPRMYNVSPRDEERYYLRLLLLHVRGATSYEDVRTVNGIVCTTFKEAARQRNLLKDDEEWNRCLEEAATFQMPRELRILFATICSYCEVGNARQLWEKFKLDMTDDFLKQYDLHVSEQHALGELQVIFLQHGLRCCDLGLPEPEQQYLHYSGDDFNANEEMQEAIRCRGMLNNDQANAFDKIIDAVNNSQIPERYFFLDGPGGTGKTFLYNTVISFLRGNNIPVIAVAWTGIATLLLKGGRTVHSRFKLPVPVLDTSTCNLKRGNVETEKIHGAEVIIWDEVTMTPVFALDAVDRALKDITKDQRPFGGKVVILGGDFRQCLPVVPRGQRTDTVEMSIKYSHLWSHFKTLSLKTNMRTNREEQEFSEWLLRLGDGKLTNENGLSPDIIEVPQVCVVNDIIGKVYGQEIEGDTDSLDKKAILCPRNEDCAKINDKVLQLLPGDTTTYFSADSVVTDVPEEALNFPVEFLNSLTPSGLPPHRLSLKRNANIMLLRNLNLNGGLCNGTRLKVISLLENVIEAEVTVGRFRGSKVFIPRIELCPSDSNLPFLLKRRQFPVRLCYAMTINKAQGQTIENVGIYLEKPVFTHGQLYVAFSRAPSQKCVHVEVKSTREQGKLIRDNSKIFTKNVVYREIL